MPLLDPELWIINCPLRGMYLCQSFFPCIDWIGSDCCHRREHRSWLHIKSSADLHRTSCAVLDMKDDRYPISGLDKGVFLKSAPPYMLNVAGKYIILDQWRCEGEVLIASPWSCLNTLLARHQVWAGFLNTWVTLHSQHTASSHHSFISFSQPMLYDDRKMHFNSI